MSQHPTILSLPSQSLVNCLHEIKTWMSSNLLCLMVVAPRALLRKVGDFLLQVDLCSISPSPEVCNLGIILDPTLSFQSHVKSTTKSAFFHVKNIARLHPSLTDPETLIHVFVTSCLDDCNDVLFGVPSRTLDRLQSVHNPAARVLTPTLIHRLLVRSHIPYKILLLIYKALHARTPST